MKQGIQGFVVGIIVGALLVPGVAMAATGTSIEVALNTVKIAVNGTPLTGSNFLYKGTTYAPVRAVGEAVGLEVGWDNGMVTLNDPTVAAAISSPSPTPASRVLTPTELRDQAKTELIAWVLATTRHTLGSGAISSRVADPALAEAWKTEFLYRYNMCSAEERADDSQRVLVVGACVNFANQKIGF